MVDIKSNSAHFSESQDSLMNGSDDKVPSDMVQLIYTDSYALGCHKKHARPSAKKNLLCTLFFFFIILAILAMIYVVFQGVANNQGVKNSKKEKDPRDRIKPPPPYWEKARTARYIVHNSNWAVLSTASVHLKGYAWGDIFSVSDGVKDNSTGVPYIYIASLETGTFTDLKKDPRVTFTFSEAQGGYCDEKGYDPESPRCARVHLVGKVVKVQKEEIPYAEKVMFSRHPVMAKWPKSHGFMFMKLQIVWIEILDYFGPMTVVDVKEYFDAKL